MRKTLVFVFAFILSVFSFAQSSEPGTGAHLPSQAAADVLRSVAASDGAFLAAGYVNASYDSGNLASLMQFPTEKIVVLNLMGSEIRQAFQRSVSLYPQPNTSFLQISGFAVEYKAAGAPSSRIVSVTSDGGTPLDLSRTYSIAMPSGLAVGALGYFKIWDKSKIVKTLDTTVEQALLKKPFVETSPRWVLR